MGASRSQSFISQPDAWTTITVGGGSITAAVGKNAVASRNGNGDYQVVLAFPIGVATTGLNGKINVDVTCNAGAFIKVVHTSAVSKQILLTDSANAPIEPTRLAFTAQRLE